MCSLSHFLILSSSHFLIPSSSRSPIFTFCHSVLIHYLTRFDQCAEGKAHGELFSQIKKYDTSRKNSCTIYAYWNMLSPRDLFVISGKSVRNCMSGCCSKPWHEWLDLAARIIYPVAFIAFASFYGIYIARNLESF